MTDHDDGELIQEAHRGPLVHYRGWLEYPESSAEIVGEILDGFSERAPALGFTSDYAKEVRKAWTVPELQIPESERCIFWTYAFIGAYMDLGSEPMVRAQVQALAEIFEWDGPIKRWTTGLIQVEDDAGHWAKTWAVAYGRLEEAPSEVLP